MRWTGPAAWSGPQMKERTMECPEYVTPEEVRRVCRELGISDWGAKAKAEVSQEEADVVLVALDAKDMDIGSEDFRMGLEVELEHGTQYPDANVTNNHPMLTAKIVLAHLKETLDYYRRLDVAELEGDLLKAAVAGDAKKLESLYRRLIAARRTLGQVEWDSLA